MRPCKIIVKMDGMIFIENRYRKVAELVLYEV